MAMFGWFVLFGLLLWASMAIAFVAGNTLGKYNISGVENKPASKIAAIIMICGFLWLLYLLMTNAPFTLTMVG